MGINTCIYPHVPTVYQPMGWWVTTRTGTGMGRAPGTHRVPVLLPRYCSCLYILVYSIEGVTSPGCYSFILFSKAGNSYTVDESDIWCTFDFPGFQFPSFWKLENQWKPMKTQNIICHFADAETTIFPVPSPFFTLDAFFFSLFFISFADASLPGSNHAAPSWEDNHFLCAHVVTPSLAPHNLGWSLIKIQHAIWMGPGEGYSVFHLCSYDVENNGNYMRSWEGSMEKNTAKEDGAGCSLLKVGF